MLTDSLSTVLHKKLVKELKETPFSLNLDECTATNNQKILSMLVSYYSEELGRTVVRPLASIVLKTVSAKTVHDVVCEVFDKEGIPYTNLISVLSDSAAYMRGKTSGFETLLRNNKENHLLDIDGDNCHHVHNAVRVFCSYFENHIEYLCDDIHMDTKWSPDIKEWLRELCEILDCNFHTPKERVPHRWLSVLDVSADILEMLPALLCMYFAYVPKDMKYAYLPLVKKLTDALDSSDYKRVLEIRKLCEDKFKASTTAGKERKK